jgi:beta-glucanase (GH16 family)
MLWTASTVSFYRDGVMVLSGATPSTWTAPMAMIVNLAVGGWGGTPDPSAFPAQLKIDYVRAYALADGSSQVVHTTPRSRSPPCWTMARLAARPTRRWSSRPAAGR